MSTPSAGMTRAAALKPAGAVGGTTVPQVVKIRGGGWAVRCFAPDCRYVYEHQRLTEAQGDARRHRWEAHLSGGVPR